MANITKIYENETDLLMPAEGYIAAALVLFLIGVFGFSLNLLVILLMWKDKQLWTPINIVLFNLLCSDLLVSIFGNPWTLASAISRKWIFGKTLCIMYGFFMALLVVAGITSIVTLTVLSFERYLIVSHTFRNMNLTSKRAAISVAGIWTYSLCLTVPPLFGWGDYVSEAAGISCSINWEDRSYNSMTYILYLFTFGLAVPVTIIIFSYSNIVIAIKQNTIKTGRTAKAQKKVALMILVMVLAFLIAWTPYAIMALIIQFGNPLVITPAMGVIPALFAKSSICYNPIIYVGMNTQQSWRRLFKPDTQDSISGKRTSKNLKTNFSEVPTRHMSPCQVEFSIQENPQSNLVLVSQQQARINSTIVKSEEFELRGINKS